MLFYEAVAKGLRGPKGRKGRKGQEALRRRFWQPEKSSGGYLSSLTPLTLSTFSTLLRHPLQGFSPAFGRDPGFRPGLAALVRGCTLGWRISPFQGLGRLPPLGSGVLKLAVTAPRHSNCYRWCSR